MKNTFAINIIPPDDEQRLKALARYRILDTPREKVFDNMTCLASEMFNMPISLVDAETVFFKSTVGVGNVRCADRAKAFAPWPS